MEKFIDTHTITLTSGNGAAGAVSFRREKYIPRGGPDGGDGGKGGDIVLRANKQMTSLFNLYPYKELAAKNGLPGIGRKRHGKDADDLIIEVPVGTVIKDTHDKVIFDLVEDKKNFILLKGGLGGRGNSNFATSTNQAPRYAQKGIAGESATVKLEIKLIADIGLVGLPNAGKSTFISVITNAKPKIANYPFTTLKPELGILKLDDVKTLVIADIPGIIPDAHKGKGLGLDFLRHIERTGTIFFVIEAVTDNPYKDFKNLQKELKAYSEALYNKNYLIGISKTDLLQLDEGELLGEFPVELREKVIFFSSAAHKGIKDIIKRFYPLAASAEG